MLTSTALLQSVEHEGDDGRKVIRLNDATPVLEVKVLQTPRLSPDKITIMIKSKPLSQATKQKREREGVGGGLGGERESESEREREKKNQKQSEGELSESGEKNPREEKKKGCEGGNRASGQRSIF